MNSSPPVVDSAAPLHLSLFHSSFASYLFEKSVHREQSKLSRDAAEAEALEEIRAQNDPTKFSKVARDAAWRSLVDLPPLAVRLRRLKDSRNRRTESSAELFRLESRERCDELRFSLRLGKIEIVGEKKNRVAFYCVERVENETIDFRYKRFNEFVMIEILLQSVSSDQFISNLAKFAPLPKPQWKPLADHFSAEFLEKRRKKLEIFLNFLLTAPMRPAQREIFERFLEEGKGLPAEVWHKMQEEEEKLAKTKGKSKEKDSKEENNRIEESQTAPMEIPQRSASRINDSSLPDSILTMPPCSPSQLP